MFDDLDDLCDKINELEANEALAGTIGRAAPRRASTLEEFFAMQHELKDGFSQPSFRRQLEGLERRFGRAFEATAGDDERSKLFLTVQGPALSRHGFLADATGVVEMLTAAAQFNGHAEFDRNRLELNRLLGLEPSGPAEEQRAREAALRQALVVAAVAVGGIGRDGKGKGKVSQKGQLKGLQQDILTIVSRGAGKGAGQSVARPGMGDPDEDM
mmetsp:Transcript_67546/g.218295  ORF Transcript_67546/g.218295 Transcript_67546/m.218295 type:complete len:214 (-) Transcript_67546:189-830(-)